MPDPDITVGAVEITSISDGLLRFTPSEFFPPVATEEWDPYRDSLTPDGKIEMNIGSFLLKSGGETVLVDTGLGSYGGEFDDAVAGLLLDDLASKGVQPEDVSAVVITHLHRDHVGWNFTLDGDSYRPTFPKARYWVPKADWDRFSRATRMAQFAYIKDQVVPLEGLGILELMEGERAITGELSALPTPGHTPGHTSFLVSSRGERAVILGDAAHIPIQAHHTDWSPRADTDAELSRETRRALMDRMEREDALVVSGHFPAPGFGRLVRLEGRRYWQAL